MSALFMICTRPVFRHAFHESDVTQASQTSSGIGYGKCCKDQVWSERKGRLGPFLVKMW